MKRRMADWPEKHALVGQVRGYGLMIGLELVEKLRRQRPDLPVLVTTGYMDELPERERSRGLNILAKPYRHEDLLDRVATALGKPE